MHPPHLARRLREAECDLMWETGLKLLAKKKESGLELEVGVQRAWGCLVGEESAG